MISQFLTENSLRKLTERKSNTPLVYLAVFDIGVGYLIISVPNRKPILGNLLKLKNSLKLGTYLNKNYQDITQCNAQNEAHFKKKSNDLVLKNQIICMKKTNTFDV